MDWEHPWLASGLVVVVVIVPRTYLLGVAGWEAEVYIHFRWMQKQLQVGMCGFVVVALKVVVVEYKSCSN